MFIKVVQPISFQGRSSYKSVYRSKPIGMDEVFDYIIKVYEHLQDIGLGFNVSGGQGAAEQVPPT
jgi:hypothetical protein